MNSEQTVGAPDQAGEEQRLQVSALVDGELDDASAARTIDELLASDELARFWLDVHRAGDWLRSEEVTGVGDCEVFLRRFSFALATEPAIVAPKTVMRSRKGSFWLRTGLPGASIAAALVVVAWVATPFGHVEDGKKMLGASTDVPAVAIAKVSPPAESAAPAVQWGPIDAERLTDYVTAHREVRAFAYPGPSAQPAAFNAPISNPDLSTSQ
jgi:negative regulator of sigma E activity